MQYDLIVVGAGVLGAFHAFHAAQMGKKVLLLEKDARQAGSSTQNFGQVVPSGLSEKWNKYGQQSLRTYQDLQIKADFTIRQNGSLYIASDEDEKMLLEELSEKHQKIGYYNLLLTKKGVLERYPDLKPEYVKAGLYYPKEMSVDPREMVFRLTEYLHEEGLVHVKYNQKVIECFEKLPGCKIRTEAGDCFTADQVIICCGYTFETLYPEVFAQSWIHVSKLQMLKTKPLKQFNLHSNILTGLTIRRYESFSECPSFHHITVPERYVELREKGIHILFKQADDGSIILGDSHEYGGVDDLGNLGMHSDPIIDQMMIKEAQRILSLPDDCIAERWAGFYGQHEEDIFIHDVDKHIKIITGIGGKGMTSASGFAEESIRQLYQA